MDFFFFSNNDYSIHTLYIFLPRSEETKAIIMILLCILLLIRSEEFAKNSILNTTDNRPNDATPALAWTTEPPVLQDDETGNSELRRGKKRPPPHFQKASVLRIAVKVTIGQYVPVHL